MQVKIATGSPVQQKTGVLVVGVFADGTLPAAAQEVDTASKGMIAALLAKGDLEPATGSTLLLHAVPGVAAERVLLFSLGARDKLDARAYRTLAASVAKALAAGKAADATIAMSNDMPGLSLAWRVETGTRLVADAAYRFDVPKQKKDDTRRGVQSVTMLFAQAVGPEVQAAVDRGLAVAAGMALTKDLGNLGGLICNPGYLAQTAESLGRQFGFAVQVLERDDMDKLGMHSLLSVGRASHAPCKFVILEHKGGAAGTKPVVLVGKGVTFDTGGVSLKAGAGLDEMKYDMCGAGSVLGLFKMIGLLKLPLNVVGLIPAVENMPGGNASRPGDVVRSMSGLTIEILNTDAEGRLILNDALTYAERYTPECVVDMATLTGACNIALGAHASGLLANDDALAAELLACGTTTGDRAWQLPLWDDYMPQLKSNFADMSNLGGPPAGTITAALFLSRFATAYKWAHLDIAATASVSGDAKGATGRPLPLMSEFLLRRAGVAAA
jgi:leucyl aminopeptidase